eukprot:6178839-Prymnesium_polylepis.1
MRARGRAPHACDGDSRVRWPGGAALSASRSRCGRSGVQGVRNESYSSSTPDIIEVALRKTTKLVA